MVDWHSLSWKNSAGKLSPARVLTTTLPNHHPMLGGRTRIEYISLTGNANAYPGATECIEGVGGGGTRYDCLGGDDESERSTFTYVSYASPRLDSGIQQRSNEDALTLREDEDEVGRASLAERLDLCCMRAMKPGMLSLDEGVGWTYTCGCQNTLLVARCTRCYTNFTLCIQQLHTLAGAGVTNRVILALFIVAQVIEARRWRRWRLG